MEAKQRRLQMFRDELESDIPHLREMLDNQSFEEIRLFAHKYKMRLDYFGYQEELELCKQIVSDQKEGRLESQASKTRNLIQDLEEIAQKLKHESTRS